MRKRIREQGVSGCLDDPVGVSKSLVAGIKRYDPNIPPFRSWLLIYIRIHIFILCNEKLPAISKHVECPRFAGTTPLPTWKANTVSVAARDAVLPERVFRTECMITVYILTIFQYIISK